MRCAPAATPCPISPSTGIGSARLARARTQMGQPQPFTGRSGAARARAQAGKPGSRPMPMAACASVLPTLGLCAARWHSLYAVHDLVGRSGETLRARIRSICRRLSGTAARTPASAGCRGSQTICRSISGRRRYQWRQFRQPGGQCHGRAGRHQFRSCLGERGRRFRLQSGPVTQYQRRYPLSAVAAGSRGACRRNCCGAGCGELWN